MDLDLDALVERLVKDEVYIVLSSLEGHDRVLAVVAELDVVVARVHEGDAQVEHVSSVYLDLAKGLLSELFVEFLDLSNLVGADLQRCNELVQT